MRLIEGDGRRAGRRRIALATYAVCAAALFVAAPLRADGRANHEHLEPNPIPKWLQLPVEVGHAATWFDPHPGPLYTWNFKFLPGVSLGIIDLQGSIAAHYHNPAWALGLGGRVGLRLGAALGGFVPVKVVGDAEWLTGVGLRETRLAGGLQLGLGSLLTLTVLSGRELDREANFLGYNLGLDVAALWNPVGAVVRYVPQKDVPDGND